MRQRILANLGFLLQTAGLLTLLPIGVGFVYSETEALIPLFITCITFLCVGFMLNALCERKDLNIILKRVTPIGIYYSAFDWGHTFPVP
jgi:hypothetical protein